MLQLVKPLHPIFVGVGRLSALGACQREDLLLPLGQGQAQRWACYPRGGRQVQRWACGLHGGRMRQAVLVLAPLSGVGVLSGAPALLGVPVLSGAPARSPRQRQEGIAPPMPHLFPTEVGHPRSRRGHMVSRSSDHWLEEEITSDLPRSRRLHRPNLPSSHRSISKKDRQPRLSLPLPLPPGTMPLSPLLKHRLSLYLIGLSSLSKAQLEGIRRGKKL